jgi:hypothetical protein
MNRFRVSGDILGDALHAIFAAEFINPRHPGPDFLQSSGLCMLTV